MHLHGDGFFAIKGPRRQIGRQMDLIALGDYMRRQTMRLLFGHFSSQLIFSGPGKKS
jgi:hypothetical protein